MTFCTFVIKIKNLIAKIVAIKNLIDRFGNFLMKKKIAFLAN